MVTDLMKRLGFHVPASESFGPIAGRAPDSNKVLLAGTASTAREKARGKGVLGQVEGACERRVFLTTHWRRGQEDQHIGLTTLRMLGEHA